jgi:hypothetical protein
MKMEKMKWDGMESKFFYKEWNEINTVFKVSINFRPTITFLFSINFTLSINFLTLDLLLFYFP